MVGRLVLAYAFWRANVAAPGTGTHGRLAVHGVAGTPGATSAPRRSLASGRRSPHARTVPRLLQVFVWLMLATLLPQPAEATLRFHPTAPPNACDGVYLNPTTGRFWTMDSFEGNASDPLSLHKYLYAHGNPVDGTDPSGHFTITEMVSVQGTDKTLRTIGSQSPRVALRASRAKIWDVYWGLIPGWPPHGAVFAANKLTPSGAGYIYDVNPINPGPQAMTCSTIPGNIRIRPTSLAAFNRQYKVTRKVATLNTLQYIAWQFEMRLLIADESLDGFTIPIDYSFYGALSPLSEASNCLTWSLKAAGAAWIQSKFGN